MNAEQINNMQAGTELDRLVGIHVFGLDDMKLKGAKCPYCGSEMRWCSTRANCPQHSWIYSPYAEYSTYIEHAWKVVEKLSMAVWPLTIGGGWAACIGPDLPRVAMGGWKGTTTARGETAPLAICRSALIATLQKVTNNLCIM